MKKKLWGLGWTPFTGFARLFPQVRRLERPFPVPGWKVVLIVITPAAVTLRMESE